MKPKCRGSEQNYLARPRLSGMMDMRNELVKLAALIDWKFFETEWAGFFPSHTGRSATSPRLVAGLLYLQHSYRLSDETVVAQWEENPCWQHFCGETFFQHCLPLDPSSLTRWRKRIGEEGMGWLLTKMIEAGREAGMILELSAEAVIVDTTVVEQAISHSTDARLYERARRRLVTLAQDAGLSLRQNYARLALRLAGQVGCYAHARQFKRMCKALRQLKGITYRVMRDIQRQLSAVTHNSLRERIELEVALVDRLLRQKPKHKGKLCALQKPEVDCISKGNARVRSEFGTQVSVTTTHKEGFVVGIRSIPGNPYDGHALREALEKVEILTETRPRRSSLDRRYRGHGVQTTPIYIAGQKRGMTSASQCDLRRRSAIEPIIGHTKTAGRLARCALKGTLGDALHAILCGCGRNIRMILANIWALWAEILAAFYAIFVQNSGLIRAQIAQSVMFRPV